METAIVFLYIISCKVVSLGHISLNKHTIVCSGSILKKYQQYTEWKKIQKVKIWLEEKEINEKVNGNVV